jgi:hypothetical protein
MPKLGPVRFIALTAALCVCVGLLLSGCFARTPTPSRDPLMVEAQKLNAEKTEAGAECNQQINTLVDFYGQHEETIEQEFKATGACFEKNEQLKQSLAREGLANSSFGKSILSRGLSECMVHYQKTTHAISELTGGSEPNLRLCETQDRVGCKAATKQASQLASRLAQETEPCVQEKIAKPINGICAIDGLGQDCILALDDGTLCMPNGPRLPACNQLVSIENRARQLGSAYQESVRTEALRSQAAAAWAQVGATQRANSFPHNTTCMPLGPGVTCNTW